MTGPAGRSTRLFWLLHGGGWSGMFLLNYLSGLAHGKPADYWKTALPMAVVGFRPHAGAAPAPAPPDRRAALAAHRR